MSGGFDKNFVPTKSTFRQDVAPVNPSGGDIWIDTSGNNVETNIYAAESSSWELLTARGPDTPEHPVEGSLWRDSGAATLKQYDGSSFQGVGRKIDQDSIVEKDNGEIKVNRPSLYVYGRFESDYDGWNKVQESMSGGNSSEFGRVKIYDFEGDYGLGFEANESREPAINGTLEYTKELDVKDRKIVSLKYYVIDNGSTNSTGSFTAELEIDGTLILNKSTTGAEGISEESGTIEKDVSGQDSVTIRYYANADYRDTNYELAFYIDDVKSDNNELTVNK